MVSGSQAWGVGSVQRAGTGNLRLGEVKARCNLIPRVSCLTAPGASEESERLQTTQTCCLGQSAEEQLLYQDHSSQIWLRVERESKFMANSIVLKNGARMRQ